MKLYPKPTQFDGRKFAIRYNLDPFAGDFGATFVDGKEMIYVRPTLPDDPPIFEAPDPKVPPRDILKELDELKARITTLETKEIR
jgi:hypothetical protein